MFLSPAVGGVNIILALFRVDIGSVFHVLEKRQPIFFWYVSRRDALKWMIVSCRLDQIANLGNFLIRFQSVSLRSRQGVKG